MITPERRTIGDIFKSDIQFTVPNYQRSFDWGKSELQDLIDDLKESKNSENKELFLGTFIFDISDQEMNKIVDGQQRLTTISIILIALREHARKINEAESAGRLQDLIEIGAAWSDKQGSRVRVSENISAIFDYISDINWDGKFPDKIKNKSVKRQVNKVKPIFNYILKELSNYNKNELEIFIKTLLKSYVIVINVEKTQDVFAIFERTNARGLDLNIGDLLKNYIFSHAIPKFSEKWDEIIENAESSLQRMLKYFWISRKGHIQQSQLYKSLRNHGSELGIEQFVNDLYTFSRYYKVVQSQDPDLVKDWLMEIDLETIASNEDYYKRITRNFQALKLFRITQAYPLIFSIFIKYKKSECNSVKILLNLLEAIENFHFVNNVISGRIGNEVEKFYAESAEEFFRNEEDFISMATKFMSNLKKKRALKDEFISNFVENITYENIPLVTYVFDRINNKNAKGAQRNDIYTPEKDIKKRDLNIEHILPQSLKSEYSTEEELEVFDEIGNLLVISRHTNSELQDKSPAAKFEILQEDLKHLANLKYLQDFIKEYKEDALSWDLDTIQERSKNIATKGFTEIWDF